MIRSISFDVARTLIGIEDYIPPWIELSDFLVDHSYELYPQELEAARNYVFMVDLPKYSIDNWSNWSAQILVRLGYKQVEQQIIDGITNILSRQVDHFVLYEDVIPTLEALKQYKLSYSAVTTIPEFKLQKVLKPIWKELTHLIHGGNAGCAKGNPKMYELDLEWKSVTVSQNLFVGDDPYFDIEIPKKMGQTTIQIERDKLDTNMSDYADYMIHHFHELPVIVEELVSMTHQK